MKVHFLVGAATTILCLTSTSTLTAQPLITGDLSVYYSFDEVDEDGLWADGSGNNLHGLTTLGFEDANDDDLDDIRLDTDNKVRGAGSALFDTDPNVKEDYIATCDPQNQPDHNDGCGELLDDRPPYVPSTAFTLAAWLKVEDVGADHSVWQSRAGGGGFIHTQVQGGGGLRFRLRGDANGDNITKYNELPDGQSVDFEEWIHFAGTYDKGPDPEGFGTFAIYYNGEQVFEDDANGEVAGTEFDILGDWGQGALIGLVPDFNRQLVGNIDEFYIFSRSLDPTEIACLANPEECAGDPGDYNADGALDVLDIDLQAMAMNTADPDLATFDENGDGQVNFADREIWVNVHRNTWMGDSNLDNEFNSSDLVAVFAAGKYDLDVMAGWSDGDWDGDLRFGSGDLVAAFSAGGYNVGPRPNGAAAVPEPTGFVLLGMGLLLMWRRRR